MKIEIYRAKKTRLFHFRIKSRNGKIVATGEGYYRVGMAIKTLRQLLGHSIKLLKQVDEIAIERGITVRKSWEDVRG